MNGLFGLNAGLGALPLLSEAESRSISAENPDGAKGGGAKATPGPDGAAAMLGKGWKVRPCITLEAGSTATLADIEGPGIIQHIWMTVRVEAFRDTVLRLFWDDEDTPSIEAPFGDFFANGHGLYYPVNSLPVAANPARGLSCYWPMPFRSRARVTIENQRGQDIGGFFYQITYALGELPGEIGYLHAQWRRSMTTRQKPEHTILDAVKGKGHYVGTFLAWTQLSNGWWGEGEIKFFIDGDADYPTICGTGTEDYFCGAWGFGGETYSTAFTGCPLYEKAEGRVPRHGLYRWHVLDPIRFKRDLRATIQALGWWPNGKFQPLTDDIASVAYWYQTEPHAVFPAMPPVHERYSR